MTTMTFRRFLHDSRFIDDPIGDLARDVESDLQQGDCFTGRLTPGRLREHLKAAHSHAVTGAFEALDDAEAAWKAAAS